MMRNNFFVLSSCAVAMTVALVAILMTGCEKREEVYPAEGNAYMEDPAFRAQLDAQVAQRNALTRERRRLNDEKAELLKKFNGDINAAKDSPEGRALIERFRASDAANVSNRLETARITRERVKRAVADSERIKRGEAKPIDLSKKQ